MNESMKLYSEEVATAVKEAYKALTKAADGDGTFEVIATTDAVDRDGEIIKADGWELAPFTKNPVLLWAHNYSIPPIGSVTSFEKQGNGYIAKGVFAKTEFAQQIRQLYDDGIVKTVSVGFIPKERNGNIITKAELLELSFVPVPSNSEALTLRRMADIETVVTKMAGKGVIADNLQAQEDVTHEDYTEKDELFEKVRRVFWAFMDVASRIEVTTAELPAIIKELSEMIATIAEGTEESSKSIAGAIESEDFDTKYAEYEAKSGRVISQKNCDKINAAIDSMTSVVEGLKELTELTNTDEKATETVEKSNLEDLQMIARIVDKSLEGLSRSIKQNLKV